MRLGGYGFSTSGVEWLFATSLAKCHTGTLRTDLDDDHINDDLDMLDDGLQDDIAVEKLVAVAQAVWSKVYEPPRTADRQRRIDFGVRRSPPQQSATPSLAEWQRQRDADVAAKSSHVECQVLPDAAVGSEGWTGDHQKEAEFQMRKRFHARLDAAMVGSIPESSLSPRMREALGYYRQYHGILNREYLARGCAEKRRKFREPIKLADSKMFIHESARHHLADRDFVSALRNQRIQEVTEVLEADICLVTDVVHMPEIIHWALMIGGGRACDVECILNNGNAGCSLFMAAQHKKKRIAWFSNRFAREYPHLARLLINKTCPPCGTWCWVRSKAELIAAARKRPSEVVAFIGATEADKDLDSTVITLSNVVQHFNCCSHAFCFQLFSR